MAERDYGRIIVLTGAGASVPLGLPTMASFVPLIGAVGVPLAEVAGRMNGGEGCDDAELIYGNLELYLEAGRCAASGDNNMVEIFAHPDRVSGFQARFTEALSQLQALMLSRWGHVDALTLNARRFSKGMLSLVDANGAPLCIFTTNYDLAFEDLPEFGVNAIVNGMHSRGLEYVWDQLVYDHVPQDAKAVVYRLHGCSHWFLDDLTGDIVYQSHPEVARKGLKPMVVFPARQKGDQAMESIFVFGYEEFRRALESCQICVVIGCSLRDAAVVSTMAAAPDHLQFIVVDDGLDTRYAFECLPGHSVFHIRARFGERPTHWYLLNSCRQALQGPGLMGAVSASDVLNACEVEHSNGPDPEAEPPQYE